jgi:hypothetical protein
MQEARRDFLRALGATSALAMCGAMATTQRKRSYPEPPAPAGQGDASASSSSAQAAQRAQLKLNEKEFRELLDSLYDQVTELKRDVDGTRTSQVFSVKVYKQTAEIERLAKKLRSLSKI